MTESLTENTQQENKKAVRWLTLGHGVVDSYSGFINPILPFIVANIGSTLGAATCALSVSQLFSSMMQSEMSKSSPLTLIRVLPVRRFPALIKPLFWT